MIIVDFLYEEYCRARLAEMRKQLLLRSPQTDKLSDCEDRKSLSEDATAEDYEGHAH